MSSYVDAAYNPILRPRNCKFLRQSAEMKAANCRCKVYKIFKPQLLPYKRIISKSFTINLEHTPLEGNHCGLRGKGSLINHNHIVKICFVNGNLQLCNFFFCGPEFIGTFCFAVIESGILDYAVKCCAARGSLFS